MAAEQSSFGNQAASHMRSPHKVSFSTVPRPPPDFFAGLDSLRSAPEICSVPNIYFPRTDSIYAETRPPAQARRRAELAA